MRKNDIKIGHRYTAKVSGCIVNVRINRTIERCGWSGKTQLHYLATNLRTGRSIEIKSPQRLLEEVSQ